MHIRLRRSRKDPSKQDVFLVKENRELSDLTLQKCWDDEQKAQQEALDSNYNPLTSVHMQRHPRTKISTDFIIEFADSGYKYIINITGGVSQWFFEKIPIDHRLGQKSDPAAVVKVYHHKFFSEELISLDRNTVDNLAALLAARGTGWICYDEANHEHYMVKIYLELDMNLQGGEGSDAKHVMHVVCGNAKLVDLFRGICGNKLKDQFSLTQIYMGPENSLVLGTSYTYLTAMARQILVKDLGWSVGNDRTVWVLPLPCELAG